MDKTSSDTKIGSASGQLDTSPDAGVERKHGVQVEKMIMIARSPAEVYGFWRRLENLPRFMRHLKSVQELDGRRSHWVAKGPLGTEVEWDAEINNDEPNQKIGWQSLPEAQVRNAGSVQFDSLEQGKSTMVKVTLRYDPPAGKMGTAVAALLGRNPAHEIEDDLATLKKELETSPAAVSR